MLHEMMWGELGAFGWAEEPGPPVIIWPLGDQDFLASEAVIYDARSKNLQKYVVSVRQTGWFKLCDGVSFLTSDWNAEFASLAAEVAASGVNIGAPLVYASAIARVDPHAAYYLLLTNFVSALQHVAESLSNIADRIRQTVSAASKRASATEFEFRGSVSLQRAWHLHHGAHPPAATLFSRELGLRRAS